MSDKPSFRICSSEGDDMTNAAVTDDFIAREAKKIVFNAAMPIVPGETPKAQMNRAAKALGFDLGHWRIRSAWYGEAGAWSAKAFLDLYRRWKRFEAKQERLARAEALTEATRLAALVEALDASDPDFHIPTTDCLRGQIHALGNVGRPLAEEGDN